MSAICGLYRRNGAPVSADAVQSMLGRLLHRGPDGHAVWSKNAVGLGHAMLHVTPESLNEPLPLVTGDDAYAITGDARIDNRAELIAALETGPPLQGLPDSALILAAYRKWGQGCAAHLLGDFAFAIWDERNKTIFCAVDGVG